MDQYGPSYRAERRSPPDPDPSPLGEPPLLDVFWAVARRLRHDSMRPLGQWGITPSQARAISVLTRHGDLRPGELARHLHIAPRSATEIVDGLVERGLIERTADPDDRRATRLHLTAAGAETATATRAAWKRESEALLGHLPVADQVELRRILDALRRHLDDRPPSEPPPARHP